MTSEDTGAYGRDIGVTLPDLLYEFVKIIPDGCMLRLGMTNPPYILDYLEDMAAILNHPRVYSFLHVPVQAGKFVCLFVCLSAVYTLCVSTLDTFNFKSCYTTSGCNQLILRHVIHHVTITVISTKLY